VGTGKILLGQWISDAKFGNNPEEKALYERNARDVTLWGDTNSPLHEYSCRQWVVCSVIFIRHAGSFLK
jgi:hypothetical protein